MPLYGLTEGDVPAFQNQKGFISEQIERPPVIGEIWCVVDMKWITQWKSYVGYETWDAHTAGEDSVHPGPIDNRPILQGDTSTMKEHLIDDLDYFLIPEEGWNKLVSWYGMIKDQEPLARKVIEEGVYSKAPKLEVYPWHLKLCENSKPDEQICKQFSRSDTIEQLEKVMRKEFNITEDMETRLWNRYMTNKYEPLNRKENTLQDAGLYHGEVVVIEMKNEDGTWPRDPRAPNTEQMYGIAGKRGNNKAGKPKAYHNLKAAHTLPTKEQKTIKDQCERKFEKERHDALQKKTSDAKLVKEQLDKIKNLEKARDDALVKNRGYEKIIEEQREQNRILEKAKHDALVKNKDYNNIIKEHVDKIKQLEKARDDALESNTNDEKIIKEQVEKIKQLEKAREDALERNKDYDNIIKEHVDKIKQLEKARDDALESKCSLYTNDEKIIKEQVEKIKKLEKARDDALERYTNDEKIIKEQVEKIKKLKKKRDDALESATEADDANTKQREKECRETGHDFYESVKENTSQTNKTETLPIQLTDTQTKMQQLEKTIEKRNKTIELLTKENAKIIRSQEAKLQDQAKAFDNSSRKREDEMEVMRSEISDLKSRMQQLEKTIDERDETIELLTNINAEMQMENRN